MKIFFGKDAQEDMDYWKKTDLKILKKITPLTLDIQNNPFKGLGKPEPLKFQTTSGYWSRRITHEHRLVYKVSNGIIYIAQCRYHY